MNHITAKRISLTLALSSALIGVGGCSDESIDPSAPATGGAAPTSPTATVNDPFRPPAAKRRVIERNPFGHVADSAETCWDGRLRVDLALRRPIRLVRAALLADRERRGDRAACTRRDRSVCG